MRGEKKETKSIGKNGKKNIVLLGSSSFCNDIGSEMITPILPLYISALGGTGIAIGALSGLREGLSSIFKLIGGWLSDRVGKRKPFVFFGYIFSSICRFLLSFASSWQAILTFVSLERFGKIRDPPRDAIIIQSTKRRGKWFGIHQLMDTSGGILGTVLVILLFWKLQLEFTNIIILAAMISSLSIIPLFFVKEPKSKKIKKSLFEGIVNIQPKLKYAIFVISVFTLANFGLYMFLILIAQKMTGSTIIPLLLYLLFNICFALLVVPFGKLSDRIGRKKILCIGYVLFIATVILLRYSTALGLLSVVFILYGMVYAITNANQRALVADLAGDMKSTAMGLFYAVTGIVNIPAGIIAGVLWDINPITMFWYLAVVGGFALVGALYIKEGNEYRR